MKGGDVNEDEGTSSLIEAIRVMNNHLGVRLIEDMTGAKHADLVRWIEGGVTDPAQEVRLRTGHMIFSMLAKHKGACAARSLMIGPSRYLGDECMLDVIRNDGYGSVITAARVHISQASR